MAESGSNKCVSTIVWLNQQEDYKSETVKGEVTVIIAPHSDTWNKDLLAEGPQPEELAREKMLKNYQISPGALVSILQERLEISNGELAELAAEILNEGFQDTVTHRWSEHSECLNVPKSTVRDAIRETIPKKNRTMRKNK